MGDGPTCRPARQRPFWVQTEYSNGTSPGRTDALNRPKTSTPLPKRA